MSEIRPAGTLDLFPPLLDSSPQQRMQPSSPDSGRLNESQLGALDLSKHIALTASAGSGKTTVLVERYLRILEHNNFQPSEIVAITFTEEGAAQLRQRIRASIRRRAESTSAAAAEWNGVARRLSLSAITTIHGFCLSLLRDYPSEAGLAAEFHLLPPADQDLGLIDSVDRTIRREAERTDSVLATVLPYLPLSKLRSILREMLQRRNHLFLGGEYESDFLKLAGLYRSEASWHLAKSEPMVRLHSLLQEAPAELLACGDTCSRRSCRQLDLLERQDEISISEFARGLESSLKIRIRPSRRWLEWEGYEELKEVWAELAHDLKRTPLQLAESSAGEEEHFRAAIDGIQQLYAATADHYQRKKMSAGAVDFDDLLFLARRLVRVPRVRRALRRRFRFFLVDEVQDTNFVQWDIVKPLIGPEGNLFAVGDAKQSIYRFRDADVSVFREVQAWIRRRGRVVELPENYRSRPALVDFSNRVFARLFRGGPDYEAEHQEMKACRSGEGRVESLFLDREPVEESDVAAAWIRRLLAEGRHRPSDIAILLRARTRLKAYEDSLLHFKVPFETVGGFGFYRRPEVYDVVNLLEFLAAPANDLSLLGLLRSPFFHFSDEEVLFLTQEKGEHLWAKLRRSSPASQLRREAATLLEEWLEKAPHLGLAETVRMALRDTGYLAIVSSGPRGAQNRANILKILDQIRSFESNGRQGLHEFLRLADTLIARDVSEAESDAGTGEERVRIYTIHGAKGLQFPVVVLPELGVPLSWGPQDRFLSLTLRGASPFTFFGSKIWNPDQGYAELAHPAYKALRRLDEFRQTAEEKRLLYVAATRARDRLLLLGRKIGGESYLKWMLDSGAEAHQVDETLRAELLAGSLPEALEGERCSLAAVTPQLEALPARKLGSERVKDIWTATEIARHAFCPRRFFLDFEGYEAKTPLWEGSCEEGEGSNPEALDRASRLGSAIHRILEEVPDLRREDLVETHLDHWASRLSQPSGDPARFRSQLSRHLSRVSQSTFYERMLAAPEQYREKRFHVRHGDLLIEGVMDRLFREGSGAWVVVDFKTTTLRSERLAAESRAKGYDLQLQFYLWAASRVLGTENIRGVLFFTYTGDLLDVPFDAGLVRRCEEILACLPRRIDLSAPFPKTTEPDRCPACPLLASGHCSGALPEQPSLWS